MLLRCPLCQSPQSIMSAHGCKLRVCAARRACVRCRLRGMRQAAQVNSLCRCVQASEALAVGDSCPDFTVIDQDSNELKLSVRNAAQKRRSPSMCARWTANVWPMIRAPTDARRKSCMQICCHLVPCRLASWGEARTF